jgi:hypothetical protein
VRVAELWRYPVKSLQGERVAAGELTPLGLAGDRPRSDPGTGSGTDPDGPSLPPTSNGRFLSGVGASVPP